MTDCVPHFLAPETKLRDAHGSDRAAFAAWQRPRIGVLVAQWLGALGQLTGRAAGSIGSAQIAQVASGLVRDPAIGPDPLRGSAVACGRWVAAFTSTLRCGIRERWTQLLCLAIVFVDQASKAVQPDGAFVVNTGGAALLPGPLDSMLWKSQTFGALCDTAGTVLLLVGLRVAHRLTRTSQRAAATGMLAGLLSNLLDRLGASSLFHGGLPRGCIDWIAIPAWPAARSNIADLVIAVGVLAVGYHLLRYAIRALRTFVRRTRLGPLAVASAGLVAVTIWTTFWQANRNTAELQTTRSETATQCTTTNFSSDGMDWLSYRPKAGPLPYHAPANAPARPDHCRDRRPRAPHQLGGEMPEARAPVHGRMLAE